MEPNKMGTWEIIGGIAGIVTIVGGIVAATRAGRKWAKSVWTNKIRRKWIIKKLSKLSDEKYAIEKDRINNEIPLQEANLKEKAGLRGLRHSSSLARELFELNLHAAKRKIEKRLTLDKEIIFSDFKISKKDIAFLLERLKATADIEKKALKEKIGIIYKDCHANNLIDADKDRIDQEIETLLKDKHTDLMIERDTRKTEEAAKEKQKEGR